MTIATPLTGIFPVAPTPFTADGALDLPGKRRVMDCMVDQGVDGICVLANYSEQFAVTDAERDQLVDASLDQVAGRVPVIVTCSHYSTAIAAERGRRAAAAGASMLMLMPPYHGAGLRADETLMVEHFARVAETARLPIMVHRHRASRGRPQDGRGALRPMPAAHQLREPAMRPARRQGGDDGRRRHRERRRASPLRAAAPRHAGGAAGDRRRAAAAGAVLGQVIPEPPRATEV